MEILEHLVNLAQLEVKDKQVSEVRQVCLEVLVL